MNHEILFEVLKSRGVSETCLRVIKSLYSNQVATMRNDPKQRKIKIKRGVRQGCVLSPVLYNSYADHAMSSMDPGLGVSIDGITLNRILYADDTALISDCPVKLQKLVDELCSLEKVFKLEINVKKTKCMKVSFPGADSTPLNIFVKGQKIEEVFKFKYLGINLVPDCSDMSELKIRIALARQKFFERSELLRGNLRIATKLKVLRVLVWSVLRYGSEVWATTNAMRAKITAFEMWCYRRILKIPFTAHTTNVQVLERLHLDQPLLLKSITRRKLQYAGHVLRGSSGKELTSLLKATVLQDNTGRGRKKTFWFDEAMKLVDNGESKATKMTLLCRRAEKRKLWRQSIEELLSMEPTLTPEDGAQ